MSGLEQMQPKVAGLENDREKLKAILKDELKLELKAKKKGEKEKMKALQK